MELIAAYDQCLDRLRLASEHLNLNASEEDLARIGNLIVQPLTGPWRLYHTIEHIFEVGGERDPLEMVAALFHDVVYIQIDLSIDLNLARFISPYVRQEKGVVANLTEGLIVRDRGDFGDDPMFDLVSTIFGIAPGDRLSPQSGQNEFLSALVAAKVLHGVFPPCAIAQIVACVEATIPFRPRPPVGESDYGQRLYQRFCSANTALALGLDETTMVDAVRRAVRLANRDVEGFAASDPAVFLDNTWNLMPETNHVLLSSSAYTARDYRLSLSRMRVFLQWLDADTIFQRFADEPPFEVDRERTQLAHRNLTIARRYLGAKLVTIAFIEALSMRIGPDLPLSMLMGALPQGDTPVGPTLEGFLPQTTVVRPETDAIELMVVRLLESGRASEVSYDLKHSPLASFFVRLMGLDGVLGLLGEAEGLFANLDSSESLAAKRERSEAFLARFPRVAADPVIDAARRVFAARSAALSGLAERSSGFVS